MASTAIPQEEGFNKTGDEDKPKIDMMEFDDDYHPEEIQNKAKSSPSMAENNSSINSMTEITENNISDVRIKVLPKDEIKLGTNASEDTMSEVKGENDEKTDNNHLRKELSRGILKKKTVLQPDSKGANSGVDSKTVRWDDPEGVHLTVLQG